MTKDENTSEQMKELETKTAILAEVLEFQNKPYSMWRLTKAVERAASALEAMIPIQEPSQEQSTSTPSPEDKKP